MCHSMTTVYDTDCHIVKGRMKNISGCIICGKPKPSSLAIASYCSSCRGIVGQIVAEVGKVMAEHGIPKPSGFCMDCGRPATCYDHRYYSMPLEVDLVCSRCNTNRGPALDVGRLGRQLLGIPEPVEQSSKGAQSLPDKIKKAERDAVLEAITACNGNRAAAARMLGIGYRSIRYRIKRLGLDSKQASA